MSAPAYYGPLPPQKQSTNGFAIASMVLGIVWIYWIGSILALVFGYIAKKQIDDSFDPEWNDEQKGRGMATAGIVLGWIGIGIAVAFFVVIGIVAAKGSQQSSIYAP